jgi:hypothetical protein
LYRISQKLNGIIGVPPDAFPGCDISLIFPVESGGTNFWSIMEGVSKKYPIRFLLDLLCGNLKAKRKSRPRRSETK